MAKVIYVPMMHSSIEMGSAVAACQAAFVARFGEPKWAGRTGEVDVIWHAIETAIAAVGVDLAKAKLYQDSLPVCDREIALAHKLTAQASRNHGLPASLVKSAATLIGTESPDLLLEEYRVLQSSDRTAEQTATLLERRDRFIGERIDSTLRGDETGARFSGALHQVARFLPAGISVEYLAVQIP
jgi:hypothetical protein